MKRILQKTLLAIACLLCSFAASAHMFEVDGIYYDITSETDKTVEVVYDWLYYTKYTGTVVIPETVTYKGTTYSVTSVGSTAFSCCTGLTSITIPNGVTSIGDWAFYECTGLTSVTIPNSVTWIGKSAFEGCTGLTSITIPNSVTSIGYSAFSGCSGLTSITIPNGVTSIGKSAFYECTGLTSVTIPNSVTFIGDYAFYGCTGLTSIIIPNGVTSIGILAFGYCDGLTSVTISESVTSIGSGAFYGCTGLTTVNFYAKKCSSMGSDDFPVFSGCTNLTTLNIGENVEYIPSYAFEGCTGLTSVTIPESVTYIGDSAFGNCTGLTTVNFYAKNCSYIGSDYSSVFSGCTNLTTLNIGENVEYIPRYTFQYCKKFTSILVAEGNSVYDSRENCNAIIETATNKLIIGCENTIIPNSVTSIGGSAFEYCTGLTSVTIPNSVTSIGEGVFYGCTGLKKILWNAQNCQSAPFGDIASQITSFEFGWDVEDIPSELCKGMTELSKVAIPNTTRTIGDNTFDGCSGLQSVTLGNKLRSIGDNAFNGCNRIKDVYAYPTQPPTIYANTFTYYVNDNATLHTIIGCKKDYEEASYWKYFYNIKQDLSAGIEGVKAEEAFSVAVVGGTLAIAGAADDAVVNIYNTNGALLHNTTVAGAADIALPNGIYLVQVNGVTQKVVL